MLEVVFVLTLMRLAVPSGLMDEGASTSKRDSAFVPKQFQQWCLSDKDCSNHGVCETEYSCKCNNGWYGSDCSWGNGNAKIAIPRTLGPEAMELSPSPSASTPPSLSPSTSVSASETPSSSEQKTPSSSKQPSESLSPSASPVTAPSRSVNTVGTGMPGAVKSSTASNLKPEPQAMWTEVHSGDVVSRQNATVEKSKFHRKKNTGCLNHDSTTALFRYASLDECEANCNLDLCESFEFDSVYGDCYVRHQHCQEGPSDADLYIRGPATEIRDEKDIDFTCKNGDKTAAALMKALLLDEDVGKTLLMGTNGFNMAPPVCQDRVMDAFCRYNNEFRSSPIYAPPQIIRQCPSKVTPSLRMNGKLATRCNLSKMRPTAATNVRLAYIVMVHHGDVMALGRLLSAIDDPQNVYVIHVDAKSGHTGVERARDQIPSAMTNRTRLVSYDQVLWGGPSLLMVYFQCLSEALAMSSEWSYVINLSGSDYPLFSQTEMRGFLTNYANHNQLSFIDFASAHSIPVPPWMGEMGVSNGVATELTSDDLADKVHRVTGVVTECKEDGNVYATVSLRRPPRGMDWREGSFWHVLHRSFVDSMFNGKDQNMTSALLDYFSVMSNPDETFFQTVAINSNSCENLCSTNLRFENWHPELSSMHPLNMTMKDVDVAYSQSVAKESLFLFARKFDHSPAGDDVKTYVDLLRQSTIMSDY
eukprot:c8034_g1_i1.p1 GENE.c8034_g1_i1~~c8034_g1_i1.p1  ORF type:complete len:701 (-),score=168.76 c8034_g1_i1:46-2148(-)